MCVYVYLYLPLLNQLRRWFWSQKVPMNVYIYIYNMYTYMYVSVDDPYSNHIILSTQFILALTLQLVCVYIYLSNSTSHVLCWGVLLENALALLLLTSAEHAEPFWSFPCSATIFSAPLLEARFPSKECPPIAVWRPPNFYLLDLPTHSRNPKTDGQNQASGIGCAKCKKPETESYY